MKDIVVIKCGGSTVNALTEAFFDSIAAMKATGKHPIIVHGGGPAINEMLEAQNIKCEFVDGLRKTTAEVLNTAEMVLAGKVNKQIVSSLEASGGAAIGLSGVDAGIIQAEAIDFEKLGFVGAVDSVNEAFLESLLLGGFIPVIAPIATDGRGGRLNINADTAASAIARALHADELLFVTDVEGVLIGGSLQEQVFVSDIDSWISEGSIYGGMIPKVKAAAECLDGNIEKITIASGYATLRHKDGTLKGTTITKEKTVK
ncbi:acetylglutamate kinase [Alteribacillus sp. HJP-4]|uniref:acetylglutamate kinase n=1 Tax=Alteribacillus sp. HJP-4 TaxID=2775394 RepID=UPI0035CCE01F